MTEHGLASQLRYALTAGPDVVRRWAERLIDLAYEPAEPEQCTRAEGCSFDINRGPRIALGGYYRWHPPIRSTLPLIEHDVIVLSECSGAK